MIPKCISFFFKLQLLLENTISKFVLDGHFDR